MEGANGFDPEELVETDSSVRQPNYSEAVGPGHVVASRSLKAPV